MLSPKKNKQKNQTREVNFTVWRFRTRLRRPSLGKPCYDSQYMLHKSEQKVQDFILLVDLLFGCCCSIL